MSAEASSDDSASLISEEYQDSEYDYANSDPDLPTGSGNSSHAHFVDDAPDSRASSLYTIITPANLAAHQAEAMKEVMEILQCTTEEARRLLMYTKWNKESLMGAIMHKDRDAIFEEAGLPPDPPRRGANESDAQEILCRICYCDTPLAEATCMDCGHAFCNDCWRQHFQIQVSEGASRRIACMDEKCRYHCSEAKVKALLREIPEIAKKYEYALNASYVEDNADVCWCPSVPHCGHAVRAEKDVFCEPRCRCGHRFCFACAGEPHSPCTCDMWARWKKKCRDDSETQNWIVANTKPCPKCGKPVEKDGGCNLVYCRCGQTFCWLCGAKTGSSHTWTEISGHTCGAHKADLDKQIDEASRNIKRYNRYHNHWAGLKQSLEAELKAGAEAKEKLANLEAGKMAGSLSDHTLVVHAYSQLHDVRTILASSYVFAFYMFSNTIYQEEIPKEKSDMCENLFQLLQQDLAAAVEHTSHLLKTAGEAIDQITPETRLEIINITNNLERRLFNLYHLIEHDILSQLTYSPNDISYYKGVRPQADTVSAGLLAKQAQRSEEPAPTQSSRGKRARVNS